MQRNTITRRRILDGVGLVGVGTVLDSSLALAGTRWEDEGGPARGAGSERPWYGLGIIGEPIMDTQLLWYLSHTGQAMAHDGECLDTAGRIDVGDENSWPRGWLGTAERVRKMAQNSLAGVDGGWVVRRLDIGDCDPVAACFSHSPARPDPGWKRRTGAGPGGPAVRPRAGGAVVERYRRLHRPDVLPAVSSRSFVRGLPVVARDLPPRQNVEGRRPKRLRRGANPCAGTPPYPRAPIMVGTRPGWRAPGGCEA